MDLPGYVWKRVCVCGCHCFHISWLSGRANADDDGSASESDSDLGASDAESVSCLHYFGGHWVSFYMNIECNFHDISNEWAPPSWKELRVDEVLEPLNAFGVEAPHEPGASASSSSGWVLTVLCVSIGFVMFFWSGGETVIAPVPREEGGVHRFLFLLDHCCESGPRMRDFETPPKTSLAVDRYTLNLLFL